MIGIDEEERRILQANGFVVVTIKKMEECFPDDFWDVHKKIKRYSADFLWNENMSANLKSIVSNQKKLQEYTSYPHLPCFIYDNFELLSLAYKLGVSIYTLNEDRKYLTAVHFNKEYGNFLNFYISRDAFSCELINETELIGQKSTQNSIYDILSNKILSDKNYKIKNSESTENTIEKNEILSIILKKKSVPKKLEISGKIYVMKENLNILFQLNTKSKTQNSFQNEEFLIKKKRNQKKYFTDITPEVSLIKFNQQSFNPKIEQMNFTKETDFQFGHVKYFDSTKEFGFITPKMEFKELFFHFHDVIDERLSKEILVLSKIGITIDVKYRIMDYVGRYQKSKKAIQVHISEENTGK